MLVMAETEEDVLLEEVAKQREWTGVFSQGGARQATKSFIDLSQASRGCCVSVIVLVTSQ